ncbi:MAG TPA: hypothetical protein VMS31_02845 [Pyrinomonadaceae bacterium]|nr:hypothetical protein [Pyrinomonadaceae bacterium]
MTPRLASLLNAMVRQRTVGSLFAAASNLAAVVLTVKGGERGQVQLNNEYWSNYGVAALTDAVRQTVGGDLDTGKLATEVPFAGPGRELLRGLQQRLSSDGGRTQRVEIVGPTRPGQHRALRTHRGRSVHREHQPGDCDGRG